MRFKTCWLPSLLIGTMKELAEKEQLSYNTVTHDWIPASKNLSEKIKQLVVTSASNFTNNHARFLLKYSHSVQDKLAEVSVKKGLTSRQLQELKEKEKQEIIQLYLQCLTHEEIGNKIGKDKSSVSRLLQDFIDEELQQINLVPDSLHCRLHD